MAPRPATPYALWLVPVAALAAARYISTLVPNSITRDGGNPKKSVGLAAFWRSTAQEG